MSTQSPPVVPKPELPAGVTLKDSSVRIDGLNSRLLAWLGKAGAVHVALFALPLVVTSAVDGKHVASSKHGKGDAVDVRINDLPAQYQACFLLTLRVQAAQFGLAIFDESYAVDMGHVHVEVAG